MSDSLIIIGFKSAGKTTYSSQLAMDMKLNRLDLDELILKHTGKIDIKDAYNYLGEQAFRKMEFLLVQEHFPANECIVFATGGGSVLNHELMQFLKKMGKIIFLNTAYSVIEERIFGNRDEAYYLNQCINRAELEVIYNKRLNHYLTYADVIIEDFDG